MSPKAIAVAGLSAIAIAASGCSGGSDAEAEFRAAFEKKFSAATWYHHITGMEVADGRLEITTDFDGVIPYAPSSSICGAAMRLVLDLEFDGVEGVQMIGSDGVEQGGCG